MIEVGTRRARRRARRHRARLCNGTPRAPRTQPGAPAAPLGDRDRARRFHRRDADARSDALASGFASALIGVEVTHFRHMAALVSTLPLGVDALRGGKLVDSTAAATCMPWIEAGCSDPDGYRLGAAIRSGLPVRVAPVRYRTPSEPKHRGVRSLRTRQELRDRHAGARGGGRGRELGDHRSRGRVPRPGRRARRPLPRARAREPTPRSMCSRAPATIPRRRSRRWSIS